MTSNKNSVTQEYQAEAQKRWGDTEAYKQSLERVGKMSRKDLEKIKLEWENITDNLAALMQKNLPAGSGEVQKQISRLYDYLKNFYDPTPEIFKSLGQMYVDDPRFSQNYEKKSAGLACFLRDAMAFYTKKLLLQTKIKNNL